MASIYILFMGLQTLTPPQDITWNRLAYSRDMIDTNFGDLKFPPKWRSSLAVYYFIVPEEEIADAYPNSRIVYLRLTCSITGWNPNEDLRNAKKAAETHDTLDDLQKSIWETITSDGWASKYWPCLGAIMQIGVYPPRDSTTGPDDYPEIMDFEPKKRELYESVTQGSEVLSATSEVNSVGKSSTHTVGVDTKINAGIPVIGGGAEISAGYKYQHSSNSNTDKSREDRETKSYSTSFSQMYQLFNGYHIGTNRALFVVAPRPHTLSKVENNEERPVEFNLIDGQRALEGIQDVFLIVHMPKKLTGFCIQASIDTGHTVMATHTLAKDNPKQPNGGEEDENHPPPPLPPDETYNELIVTRRMVQNCGTFDDNGNFVVTGVPGIIYPDVVVVWEDAVLNPKIMSRSIPFDINRRNKIDLVNRMNTIQRRFIKSMISGFSAGNFEPTEFVKSKTFQRQAKTSIQNIDIPLSRLVEFNYLSRQEAAVLMRNRIMTAGDIFKDDRGQSNNPTTIQLRNKILKKFGI